MSRFNVVFSLLGILAQYIAVPVLTEKCCIKDSTLGALAWLTISGSSVMLAFATQEWHIWVAVTVAFLELVITTSIRSNISKVVGPFEIGAVFSILATFQAENFFSLICGSYISPLRELKAVPKTKIFLEKVHFFENIIVLVYKS